MFAIFSHRLEGVVIICFPYTDRPLDLLSSFPFKGRLQSRFPQFFLYCLSNTLSKCQWSFITENLPPSFFVTCLAPVVTRAYKPLHRNFRLGDLYFSCTHSSFISVFYRFKVSHTNFCEE